VLTLILCEDYCSYCGTRLVKNPLNSGDWYPTFRGLVLQRYCENCGAMYPYVSIPDGYISNRTKVDLAKLCAGISGRGMIEMKKIAKGIQSHELCYFLDDFLEQSGLSPHVLSNACHQLGI